MQQKKSGLSLPERLTDAYLVLLMTALVFAFGSEGYLNLDQVKEGVFLWLCGGYAALCALIYLEELLIGRRRGAELGSAVKGSAWVHRLMVVYLALTLLSALLSAHGAVTWRGATRGEGARTIALYVLCFLLVSAFGRPKAWMAHLLAVTVTAQAVLCALQLSGGNPLGIYPEGVNYFDAGKAYSGAYLGTIGNVDYLGAYFCLAVPILWVSVLRLKTPWRFLYLAPLALSLYVLLRMWVLSSIVGVVLGGLIVLPVVLPAPAKTRKRLAAVFGGGALAAAAALFLFDFGGGALHTLHEMLHGRVAQTVDSGRLYIWREVLQRVPQHLLFGAGPDTLALAEIPPFRRYDAALGMELVGHIDVAHNEYLNVLYHQGLPALAAYLGALIAALIAWGQTARERSAAAVLGAAVFCYALQAFFNISTFFTAPLFWAVLGLLAGCCGKEIQKRKGR